MAMSKIAYEVGARLAVVDMLPSLHEKTAVDVKALLQNPTVRRALVGAGIGGAGGAGLGGDVESALLGAGIGGTASAGLGKLYEKLNDRVLANHIKRFLGKSRLKGHAEGGGGYGGGFLDLGNPGKPGQKIFRESGKGVRRGAPKGRRSELGDPML